MFHILSDNAEFDMPFKDKVKAFPFFYLFVILLLCTVGIVMLYSAAGGSMQPWAIDQLVFLGIGMAVLLITSFLPPTLLRLLAWPAWFGTLCLLLLVYIMGHMGGGAARWLAVGPIRIQPSELAKYTTVLLLAHVAQTLEAERSRNILQWLPAIVAVLSLVLLTMFQPDMGTSLLILAIAAVLLFLAGLHWVWYVAGLVSLPAIVLLAWNFVLKPYQKNRVLTFLNPERDPLGTGYHIMQSKIAIGSGGLHGKGFLESTQGGLNFLPEKQTDFIFTLFSEEFGFYGALLLIALYAIIITWGYVIAWQSHNQFGRLLALGATTNFFFYMFINMGMVIGLLPVVGVPLPLVSKGGTSMVVILFGFGLVINSYIHRHHVVKKHYV